VGRRSPTAGEVFVQGPNGDVVTQSAYGMQGDPGMTLRDYFAAVALPVVVRETNSLYVDAKNAYAMADAMLEVREENKTNGN